MYRERDLRAEEKRSVMWEKRVGSRRKSAGCTLLSNVCSAHLA